MALISIGLTRCAICHKVIEKGQEYIAFPPIVSNLRDPLIIFHDGVCHQDCFTNHPLATLARTRLAEVDIRRKRPHLCTVCDLEITNPDDFFVLSHWTDDMDSKLYEFNYLKFHGSHLLQWPRLNVLYELLLELEKSGTWEGTTLPYIIETIRKHRTSPRG